MEFTLGNQRPLGVTIVAVLTLLSAIVMFVVLGEGYHFVHPNWNNPFSIFVVLSVYGFFLSILMFNDRTRYTWYASIVFWIVFLVSFVWWYTASYTVSGGWQYVIYMDEPPTVAGILAMLSPLVYATGCLTYFMSRTPRQYFF
jgi:hypothetical protein